MDEEIFHSSATSEILDTKTDLQLKEQKIQGKSRLKKLEHEDRMKVEDAEFEERLRRENEEREDTYCLKQ